MAVGRPVRDVLQIDSVRISYQRVGTGPPLVLVHGLAGSGRWWRHNLRALTRRFTVYIVDLVGFGSSGHQEFLLDAASGYLVRWMDHLGIERASFIGHSMGGYVVG